MAGEKEVQGEERKGGHCGLVVCVPHNQYALDCLGCRAQRV